MTAEYKIKISGDASGLQKAGKQAEGVLSGLSSRMTSLQRLAAQTMAGNGGGALALLGGTGGAAAIGAIGAVGAALLANAAKVATTADEFGKLSQRTGVAVEDLSRLAHAANLNDASMKDLENGLRGLSKQMQAGSSAFGELGISVRDSAGNMRPVKDVLLDVAEAFKRLPDGAKKAALANRLMEESGLRLIPLLNNGADGLRAMADEADRLGVTMSTELAARSAEFNDNLARMKAAASGLANEIGASLVPALAAVTSELLKGRNAGLNWAEAIFQSLFGSEDPSERVKELTADLERLQRARIGSTPARGKGDTDAIDREIERVQKAIEAYQRFAQEKAEAPIVEERKAAVQREQIERDLTGARSRLFDLLAVKHGKASNEILLADNERTKAQLKNAQELAKGFERAYDSAVKSAREAAKEAAELLRKGAAAASSREQQAQARLANDLTPEQRESDYSRAANDLIDQARRSTTYAQNAAIDKRAVKAQEHAERALALANEAGEVAGRIGDNGEAAKLLREVGKIEKEAAEAQARVKQQEQSQFDGEAQEQLALLQEQLAEVAKLKNIPIDADITEATNKITSLRADLDNLKDKTVTVTVLENRIGGAGSDLPAKAGGGMITGPGTGTSDSILARLSNGEFVIRAAAVRHYGPGFLDEINRMMTPRFALGGLVANVAVPSIRPAGAGASSGSGTTTNLVLNWPDGASMNTPVADEFGKQLARHMSRASLQRGGRKP